MESQLAFVLLLCAVFIFLVLPFFFFTFFPKSSKHLMVLARERLLLLFPDDNMKMCGKITLHLRTCSMAFHQHSNVCCTRDHLGICICLPGRDDVFVAKTLLCSWSELTGFLLASEM